MTKRITALAFAIILLISLALVPASAEASYTVKLDDSADLLSDSEESKLLATMQELSDACQCNVVFITTPDLTGASFSFNGTADDYAFRYYETTCGVNVDGLLVYVTLKDEGGKRKVGVFGTGKCEKRLTNSESDEIRSNAISKHNPDTHSYYDFLNSIALGLKEAVPPHLKWYMLPIAIGIGFFLAFLIMNSIKKKLTTVAMQHGAASYVRAGSMNVTQSRDTYLYSTVTRTAKPKNNSGSSHSSGGGSYSGGSSNF